MSARTIVDLMSLISGFILILNEVVIQPHPATLALVFGAMLMGLPALMPTGEERDQARGSREIKPKESKKISRKTDLRIAQRPPEHPIETQVRKDMEYLAAYDKKC